MADFDIWDHMFLRSYCGGLTLHQFAEPPSMVLDVGCGNGYWAIEAAKEWTNSKITGLDLVDIQPRLHAIEPFQHLSARVTWVHSNLLEGLPFPSDHFDFVRVAGLGLAVPEDEWPLLLEEIHRVMKPGAFLEITEEDLIFPSASTLLQSSEFASPPSPSHHLPVADMFKSRSSTLYERSSSSPERSTLSSTSASTQDGNFSARFSVFLHGHGHTMTSRHSSTSTLNVQSPPLTDPLNDTEHPQDHTRLKVAWEGMLSTRFLSSKIISVIPFYLTSSSFVNTKAHPPLMVPLPPNSGSLPTLKACRSMGSLLDKDRSDQFFLDNMFDLAPSPLVKSSKTDPWTTRAPLSSTSRLSAPAWGTMHLSKKMSTIRGCKEAIWEEYRERYSRDVSQILLRTAPNDEDYSLQTQKYIVRRAFEVDWKNWELDMLDRMAMRSNLLVHAGWSRTFSEADSPEWATWRDSLNRKSGAEPKSGHLVTGYNPDDLCRSLRTFTGFKA
ncbi:unnamed protein product [Cyclocybe aegerita]|uniref:Methyltransferase domain-containing protein n=1 Tax=Cyclocybe aegerita TaxID=1973307 RepID=A0A8S0VSG6_CYCAE|nr:unnamed protein product [Cyclocybe aegerita]